MSYTSSQQQLNVQLLIGLKRHLLLAQSTSESKEIRLGSLANLSEVLEYVCLNINEAVPEEEQAIYRKFFMVLLTKVTLAKVQIHQRPAMFTDEIGFISTILSLR